MFALNYLQGWNIWNIFWIIEWTCEGKVIPRSQLVTLWECISWPLRKLRFPVTVTRLQCAGRCRERFPVLGSRGNCRLAAPFSCHMCGTRWLDNMGVCGNAEKSPSLSLNTVPFKTGMFNSFPVLQTKMFFLRLHNVKNVNILIIVI